MAYPLDKRPSVAVGVSSANAPSSSASRDVHQRNSSLAPSPPASSSSSSASSTHAPPSVNPSSSEFLRNLVEVKAFSTSKNPRVRRHASLDIGVAQYRARQSIAAGMEHDLSPHSSLSPASSTGFDEKSRLYSFAHDASDSPLYSPFPYPRRAAWWKKRSNVSAALSAAVTLFFLGGLVGLTLLEGRGKATWWGVKEVLEDLGVASFQHTACVPLSLSGPCIFSEHPLTRLSLPRNRCENPYAEFGRIHVDKKVPENNRWLPYDPSCAPPAYMAALRASRNVTASVDKEPEELELPLRGRRAAVVQGAPLEWLHGKTVLLFGDHIERNHNKDFCRFAGGKFATIGRDHPLSPPRFVNGIDEKFLPGANQENFDGTRPSVCYFDDLDFMVVSVFHFGLANRVEFEHESLLHDPHFYPPGASFLSLRLPLTARAHLADSPLSLLPLAVAVDDRLSHIVMPLLDSLKRTKPDLIEFSSGFWDLRHFAALDELSGADPHDELSPERLSWYSTRLTRALADLGSAFPDTPLLWRTLHQTPDFKQTSPARVAALDQISRKVAHALNEAAHRAEAEENLEHVFHFTVREHERNHPVAAPQVHMSKPSPRARERADRARPNRRLGKARFLNRVKERIGSKERVKEVQLSSDETSLRGRVRVDEWGALMRGQEHTMEKINTPPLPGGYLWGDIMLFECVSLPRPPSPLFVVRLALERALEPALDSAFPSRSTDSLSPSLSQTSPRPPRLSAHLLLHPHPAPLPWLSSRRQRRPCTLPSSLLSALVTAIHLCVTPSSPVPPHTPPCHVTRRHL